MRINTGLSIASIPSVTGRAVRLARRNQDSVREIESAASVPWEAHSCLLKCGERTIVKYYIAVCVPLASGGWRATFPDVPNCGVEGSTLDRAVFHAADALSGYAERLNGTAVQVLKGPRDLTTIRSDKSWGAADGIDWSAAIITMIPLRV